MPVKGDAYEETVDYLFYDSCGTASDYTQPWYTSDISLSKDLKFKFGLIKAAVEVNNLLSQDYDVILNYPMPKRNYKVSLTIEI